MPDGLFANPLHWVILLVVVLIIFGPGKLPSIGTSLGKSLREFKKATRDDDVAAPASVHTETVVTTAPDLTSATAGHTGGRACAVCGFENSANARFCEQCSSALATSQAAEPARPVDARLSCPACGTVNHASNRFCAHCGRLFEQPVSTG